MSLRRKDRIDSQKRQQVAPVEPVEREGWLHKEGGAAKNKWQARWFRLQGKTLYYFIKKDDSSPQGSIQLEDILDISKVGDHSGKPHCFSLVTTKGGGNKKVYYLAADTEECMNEWCAVLQAGPSPLAPMKMIKYATAEVFLTQGVRISGDVHYNILSLISHRMGPEKKKRDAFGWFCDRPIALAMILNIFAEYGWNPERIYRSSAVSGTDNSIQPVVRVIFSKSPTNTQQNSELTHPRKENSLTRSGNCDTVTVSTQPVATVVPPGSTLLEGSDDELISLMQEFGIPLTLLVVSSEQ